MLTIRAHRRLAAPPLAWKAVALGALVFLASFPLWH